MGAIATFDPVAWAARYPEFSSVPSAVASEYAAEATLYLANDGSGVVQDAGQQLLLLNMLTAHIAQLNATVTSTAMVNGQSVTTTTRSSSLVGRISSASEGSVSASTDVGPQPGSAAWYMQTPYGFSFWQATRQYRSMRYIPSRALYPFGGLRRGF